MKIEYVASGMSFIKLVDKKVNEFMLQYKFHNWFQKLSNRHKFAMLYNAFQEEDFTNNLQYYGVPLYADSGGLQMMTTGVNIDDKRKQSIYEVQMVSDYAFCFDEVPIERIDKKRRIVFKDEFFEKGKITGNNIKDQINFFREHNAKTKVFLIAQGQELEDYQNYINGILSQLNSEDFEYVAGFAFSVACSGGSQYSTLKAILASLKLQELDLPDNIKNRIHYLGFGSLKKFTLIKEISKHFNPNLDISADSTSITMGYYMGHYHSINKIYDIRRYSEEYLYDVKDPILELIFSDMKNFIKKYDLDITDEYFEKIKKVFIRGTYLSQTKLEDSEQQVSLEMLVLYFLTQVDNMLEGVEQMDLTKLEHIEKIPYHSLLKVDTIEEMDKLVNKIIKKPQDIHPRVCSNSHKKMQQFKNLF